MMLRAVRGGELRGRGWSHLSVQVRVASRRLGRKHWRHDNSPVASNRLGQKADGVVGSRTMHAAEAGQEDGKTARLLSVLDQRVVGLSRLVQSKPTQAV